MSHNDFEFEPQPGLPAPLPAGESLLWQGSPHWQSLAVRAYHVRKVVLYFAGLTLWRIGVGIHDHHAAYDILVSSAFLVTLGAIAAGVLSLLAYLNARSTIYSITTRRVLLRHGVAVPLTMNVPFDAIEAADVSHFRDGTGDISLTVPAAQRIGYLISWPHVRPGRITRPSPSLRGLADLSHAAALLAGALAAHHGGSASRRPEAAANAPAARPQVAAQTAAA
jgi:hypothetical protein